MQDTPRPTSSSTQPGVHRRPPRAQLTPPAKPSSVPIGIDSLPSDPPEASSGSIIQLHRTSPVVHITHETVVVGPNAEALWEVYRENFEPLATLAMLEHFYSRDEVLAELANPRIVKIVGWQEGQPVGFAMVTNSLDDVPQISPQFLRAAYPEHAALNRIYYGILVTVMPSARGLTLFSRLYIELWQIPALVGGILVFDVCDFNRQTFDSDKLAQRVADNFPHSNVRIIDSQTWYVAELPKAIPNHPSVGRAGRRS